ncbi:MAG: tRNA uridine-5-carboxymethylaminomethyl(34) synthesis GTPase MnmE [Pseudomonadales bacterium]
MATDKLKSDSPKADTIAAVATPSGRGGVGIVRVSGPCVTEIAEQIIGGLPPVRKAVYKNFLDQTGTIVDQGLALFFKAPNSFTGEDVLELQGHGGPIVMDMLLTTVLTAGARQARPGEFSERAFLNDKIDLSQAEAIADLIDSSSQHAARGAMRSLQGEFSNIVRELDNTVVELRMYVEAAIDFPEEEIDFLSDGNLAKKLQETKDVFVRLIQQTKEGALLREGVSLVLAGKPNAGKSSLMNQLSGRQSSIVTAIEGTTRDLVNEHIQIDGIPLNLIDTAGLRPATDEVEEEGVRRALAAVESAEGVLLLIDLAMGDWRDQALSLLAELPTLESTKVVVVLNKQDLVSRMDEVSEDFIYPVVRISAKNGQGIDELRSSIKSTFGMGISEEGVFIARTRHLEALLLAQQHLLEGISQLEENLAGDLLAEELRLSHQKLCEITGEFSSDDLLGKIFSSFCIGK